MAELDVARLEQLIPPDGGEVLGPPDGLRDRFLVGAAATGGTVSLTEHILPARALAAPLHRHSREDEYSYILAGQVGARLGDQEHVAGPGAVLHKPRGQWHTFWNAGDSEARLLEIIVPGGLEELFRTLDLLEDWPEPDELAAMAATHGISIDLEATMPLIERHGLSF